MEMRVKFFCAKHCVKAIEADLCMFMKRILVEVSESSEAIYPSGGQKMGVFCPLLASSISGSPSHFLDALNGAPVLIGLSA